MSALRNSLIWSFAERYAGLLLNLTSTVLLARLLTPSEVGIFSVCAAVVAVAGILRDFGVSEYLIQERNLTVSKIRGALAVAIIVAWGVGAVIFLSIPALATYLEEPAIAEVIEVLCLNFLLLPFASPAFALLNREMNFRAVFLVQFPSNIVQSFVSVGLAYHEFGYMALAWGSVSNTASQLVIVSLLRPKSSMLFPSLRAAGSVWHFGILFCFTRLIESFTRNIHEFFIAKQLGFASLGIFSRGLGVVEMFYTLVTSASLRVVTAALADDFRQGKDLKKAFCVGTEMLTGVAWPFFSFVALSSALIIEVLFGEQWSMAAPITSILCVNSGLAAFGAFGPNVLIATGNVKTRFYMSLRLFVIQIAGVAVGSLISLKAVSYAWLISGVLGQILIWKAMRTVIQISLDDWLQSGQKSAMTALAVTIVQYFAIHILELWGVNTLMRLLILSALAFSTWWAAIVASSHPLGREIKKMAFGRGKVN